MNNPELNNSILTLLIKSTLYLAAVWIAFLVIRKRSASAQSHFWRSAVVGMLVLTVAACCLPWLKIAMPQAVASASNSEPLFREWRSSTPSESSSPILLQSEIAPSPATTAGGKFAVLDWLGLLWGFGVVVVLSRSAHAAFGLHRLRRQATTLLESRHWRGLLESGQLASGSTRLTRLFQSTDVKAPLVCGIIRPTIFLPKEAADWDEAKSRMVLTHELVHVKRRDAVFLAVGQFCLALNWVNPLMWLAIRRLQWSNELAADDAVLASGCPPSEYADILLDVARRASGNPPVLAAAMAQQPSAVGERVEKILDDGRSRDLPGRSSRVFAFAIMAVLAATTGGAMLVSGQDNVKEPAQKAKPPAPLRPIQDADGTTRILEKLHTIIIPSVDFEEATVEEAVDYLRRKTAELDAGESDPSRKGVNFVLRSSKNAKLPEGPITLKLTNVPVVDALRYVAELANCRFKVEPLCVVILSNVDENSTQLYTRSFRVPPMFSNQAGPKSGGKESRTPGSAISPRALAKDILQSVGIVFPEGASAHFAPASSTLIVRNTESQMELVEVYVDSITNHFPAVLNVSIEIYGMTKSEAFTFLSKYGAESVATEAREMLVRGLKDDSIRLIAAPHLVARSGKQAKIESGQAIDYVSAYTVKDGRDEAVNRSVFAGIQVELEPVLGADGFTIDVNLMITEGVGEPKIETRKAVAPISGKEVEISSVRVEQMTLNTSTIVYSGQPRLVGIMNSPKLESDEAHVVFLTITNGANATK